jgi:hypothetical protein
VRVKGLVMALSLPYSWVKDTCVRCWLLHAVLTLSCSLLQTPNFVMRGTAAVSAECLMHQHGSHVAARLLVFWAFVVACTAACGRHDDTVCDTSKIELQVVQVFYTSCPR